MSLIFINSINNFKSNKNKIFFRDLKKSINGKDCLQFIGRIIFFLKKNKIKNISINSNNSIYFPLWYIAADYLCNNVYILNPEIKKKVLKQIVKQNNIEYVVEKTDEVVGYPNVDDFLSNKFEKIVLDDRSDILFTSGTTDVPKGVVINESTFNHVAKILIKKFKQSEEDVELLSMPFYHSFGLTRLRCVLLANSSSVILDGLKQFPDAYKLSQNIKITGLSLVPSGIDVIKNLLRKKTSEFTKNIRYFEIGSSALNNDLRIWLKENFTKTLILHHYGTTEASRSFLRERGIKDDFNSPDNWIGEPIEGCSYKININSKDKNKSNGELILKGKNVFSRYLEESLNKKKRLGNYFKTGDICSIENHKVLLIGRNDNQFNIGGFKVQAELIEQIIEEIHQVKSCVCFRSDDKLLGDQINCTVELIKNEKIKTFNRNMKEKFIDAPQHHKPKKIYFQKVKLTSSGKKIRNINIK